MSLQSDQGKGTGPASKVEIEIAKEAIASRMVSYLQATSHRWRTVQLMP